MSTEKNKPQAQNFTRAQHTEYAENTFFWNIYGRLYDGINYSFPYRKLLWDMLALLDLEAGQKILDAGCGTGNFEKFLAEKNAPPLKIEAVDFSTAMLSRAEKKCKQMQNVRFSRADLNLRLNFPDNAFDRILCVNVLYALKDPHFTLSEFSRVIKPGGKILVATPKPGFKVGVIVQDHFRRINNVWGIPRRLWSATKTLLLLPTMGLAPILLNVFVIQKKGQKQEYHFFPQSELLTLFEKNNFEQTYVNDTYADQNWLAQAVKPEPRKIKPALSVQIDPPTKEENL